MNKMLMVATVPSMIGSFNMGNIHILRGMGYEVHVACNFRDTSVWPRERVKEFVKQLAELEVKYHQIDFSRNPKDIAGIRKSYMQMSLLLKQHGFRFVHCHTPIAGVIARICCHKNNVKVIYTAHGFHFYDGAPIKNWLFYYPIEKFLSRYTDVLITINKEDYKRAKRKFKAKKMVYIPGVGVDTEKFTVCKVDTKAKRLELGVKEDDFLLLSVGELSERKNQKVVIDALGRMKSEGSIGDIVYLAVGQGDMQKALELLIKQYSLDGHVKLLGYRSDIDELCETADCFVHPSVREGLGMAPLEGMAAGLPLISANVNGIRDYTKDGVSGCSVDPADVDAVIRAIKRMHDDEEFRNRCAANNYKTVKTFDIRNTAEIMSKVYRGV